MIVGDPKPPLDELAHHGVKGMHWGIRKQEESSGILPLQGPYKGPTIEPTLHKSTQESAKKVAFLMAKRYNFNITEVKDFGDEKKTYAEYFAFVKRTPGKPGAAIYANTIDLRAHAKEAEDSGWYGKGNGNLNSIFTHESAHALFHAEETTKLGLTGRKTTGGYHEARDHALKLAMKEAKKEGVRPKAFASKVSGYAVASGKREELEAELFAQYHWSTNPPKFIKVWGETLHNDLGIDPTPFREERS